jgi:SAM-dependent methyltransferase
MSNAEENHLEFYRRWHKLAGPYFQWQYEQFAPYLGARVADVGCGPGNLTANLLGKDYYLGVDLDPDMLTELRREYGSEGPVDTAVLDVSDPGIVPELQGRKIDSILCCNLVEHIEDDRAAITNLTNALPAGGTLGILVPAMPWLYGSLDRLDNHYRRYTKKSLVRCLDNLPLTVEKLHYFNFAAVPGWWWKGRVIKEQSHASNNFRMMNMLIPVLGPVEKLVKPPFGLSLILVARREADS